MIARILFSIALLLAAASVNAKVDWTDIWFNAAEPGWGVNLVQSDAFMFATFFVYDSKGLPTWYTAQMTWDGTRLAFVGPLYATTGTGLALPWQPGNLSATAVGTASFTPTQGGISVSYRGTLTYSFNATSLTVSKSIERQTLTSFDLGGLFTGGQYGEYYDCTTSTSNQTYTDSFTLEVTQVAVNGISMSFEYQSGLACTLSGTAEQHGSLHRINGAAYKCSDGLDTTAFVYDIETTSLGIQGRIYAPSVGRGCKEAAKFSSVHATGLGAE